MPGKFQNFTTNPNKEQKIIQLNPGNTIYLSPDNNRINQNKLFATHNLRFLN